MRCLLIGSPIEVDVGFQLVRQRKAWSKLAFNLFDSKTDASRTTMMT